MSHSYEKPYKPECETCPALGFQDVVIGVPVEIKPFAKVGKVKTECIGKLDIHHGSEKCEGRPHQTCKFTVSQKMRVEVPVIFGAKTEVGEAHIDCKHHCSLCEHPKEREFSEEYSPEEMFRGIIG